VQRDGPEGRRGLKAAPLVRAERHGLAVEAYVLDFEAKHLGSAPTRQQERGDERVGERQGDVTTFGNVGAGEASPCDVS